MIRFFRSFIIALMLLVSSTMIPNESTKDISNVIHYLSPESLYVIEKFDIDVYESNKIDQYPAICPIATPEISRISSPYGPRMHPIYNRPSIHRGVDFAAPRGSKVITTGDGIVAYTSRRGGYGNLVIINHSNGYKTRYGHLDEILVNKGDTVYRGNIIGKVGSTGLSTGNHLHYEIIHNNKRVDPLSIFPDTLNTKTYIGFMTKLNEHLLSCSDDV